jgi:pyruvate dehydrogenase (quinone)
MPRILEIAMQSALSKGGIAVVVLPGDVALSDAVNQDRRITFTYARPEVTPCREELDRLAAELNRAQKVTILAGGRLRGRAR